MSSKNTFLSLFLALCEALLSLSCRTVEIPRQLCRSSWLSEGELLFNSPMNLLYNNPYICDRESLRSQPVVVRCPLDVFPCLAGRMRRTPLKTNRTR